MPTKLFHSPTLLALALLTLSAPAFAVGPTCGGEGQSACTLADIEYFLIGSCEFDLKKVDGKCVPDTRHNLPFIGGWLGFALHNQRYGIGGDTPLNFISTIGAHNAYASTAQGFAKGPVDLLLTNQYYTITDLLNSGARFLEIDPHWFAGTLVVCHSSDTPCQFASHFRYLNHLLFEISLWVQAHPNEVLMIKFDDHIAGRERELIDHLTQAFGNRIYSRPQGTQVWPSVNQVRAAGKNIVVYLRNTHPINQMLFDGTASYVTSSDHPQDFNFQTCTDGDFQSTTLRGASRMAAMAEGRSGSNFFDFTGLLYEPEVAAALKCNVSTIGMDFILRLDKVINPFFQRTSSPDDRIATTIWSWAPNDFGEGRAILRSSTKRWHSTSNDTQSLRYACATTGYYFNERNWRVTQRTGPWAQGDAICKSEFGSSYGFSYPVNAFQNFQLTSAAGANDVWLSYNPQGVKFTPLSVLPISLSLSYAPGSSLPLPTTMTIYGAPGTNLIAKPDQTWLSVATPNPAALDSSGMSTVAISLTAAAQLLAPGTYSSSFVVADSSDTSKQIIVPVTLLVKSPSSITLTTSTNPAPETQANAFTIRVSSTNSNPLAGGTVYIRELFNTNTDNPQIVDRFSATVNNSGATFQDFKPDLLLAGGTHQLVAYYDGGQNHTPSTSAQLNYIVTPRIQATPNPVQFTLVKGQALPASRSVSVTGGNSSLSYVLNNAPWLTKSGDSPTGVTLQLNSQASSLAPGSYAASVSVKDTVSSTELPVLLSVVTPLQVSRTTSTLVTSGTLATDSIQITNTDPLPLTVQTSSSWLTAQTSQQTSPATLQIAVDGTQLALGQTFTGTVTVSSTAASSPVVINVTVHSVRPTVIDSVPSGLTFSIDNTFVTTPATYTWLPGSSHNVLVPNTQGGTASRHRFLSWNDSGPQNRTLIASLQGGSLVATHQLQYSLTTNQSTLTGGTLLINPPSLDGFYNAGTLVTVTAQPASGKTFDQFTGTVNSPSSGLDLVMNQAHQLVASFKDIATQTFTITANRPGGSVIVDGVQLPVPVTLNWLPNSTHTLSVPTPVSLGHSSRLVFGSWSDGSPNSHSRTFTAASTLQLNLIAEHYWNAIPSPLSCGTVTGSGWYAEGSTATLTATPTTGCAFSNYSGSLTSSANPFAFAVTAPLSLTANFTITGRPTLYASSAARVDGAAPNQRLVPLQITNAGTAPASNAVITGITAVTVLNGTGSVTPLTATPINLGDIGINGTNTTPTVWDWPATATRVRFTVTFSANGGAYTGSTVLTLTR